MADQPRPKKKLKLGLSKKKKKKKLEALNIGEAAPAAPVIAHRAGSLKKPSTTVPPTAHQQIHQQQNVRRLDAPPASPHLPAKIAHIDPLQSMNNTGTNADSNTKNNAAAAADAAADAEPTTTAATATATPSRHPTSAGNAHVSTSAPSSTSSSKRKPRKKLRRKRKVEASPPRDLLPTAGEGQDHAAVAAAAAAAAGCTGAAAGLGTLGGAATHPESRAQYNPNPAAVAKAEVARRFLKAMAIKGKMEPLPMPRNYSSSSPPLSSPTTIMPVPALATALIFTANAMHSNSRRHEEKSIQSFLPTVQSLELTPSSTIHSAWAPARKNAFW